MHQKLLVAFSAQQRRFDHPMRVKIQAGGGLCDFFDDTPVIRRGPHHTAFANPSFANFKLGLYERNRFSAGLEQNFHNRQDEL
jgi:hypothetical protein